MVDTQRIDLVLRAWRGRVENAAGDFFGFVDRIFLGDCVGDVDRQEFGFAAGSRRCSDGVYRDLALERADRHERVERGIARHLGRLVGGELADGDLFRIDAGLLQDDAQQLDVGLCPSDHADAMAGQGIQCLHLRRRLLPALGRKPGRRPQHDDVLAQDGNQLGIGRQVQVAARYRKIGLAGGKQRDALLCSLGRDRQQPNRTALARKGLRHQLDEFLVLAAGGPDGNPQRRRPQHVIERARGDAERQHARGEDQKRVALSLLSRAGRRRIIVCV